MCCAGQCWIMSVTMVDTWAPVLSV